MDVLRFHTNEREASSELLGSGLLPLELLLVSANKNIREMYKGITEFKKGYQPRAYVIKKHDGTIVADTIVPSCFFIT